MTSTVPPEAPTPACMVAGKRRAPRPAVSHSGRAAALAPRWVGTEAYAHVLQLSAEFDRPRPAQFQPNSARSRPILGACMGFVPGRWLGNKTFVVLLPFFCFRSLSLSLGKLCAPGGATAVLTRRIPGQGEARFPGPSLQARPLLFGGCLCASAGGHPAPQDAILVPGPDAHIFSSLRAQDDRRRSQRCSMVCDSCGASASYRAIRPRPQDVR